MHILIDEAVNSKREGISGLLDHQNAPFHVREYAMNQIDAETERERFELRAAFASLRTGRLIFDEFISSMVAGRVPCIR